MKMGRKYFKKIKIHKNRYALLKCSVFMQSFYIFASKII